MKMQNGLFLGLTAIAAFLSVSPGAVARPDANVGTVNRVLQEARELNQTVRMARVSREAQRATFEFLKDVERLDSCTNERVRRGPGPINAPRDIAFECSRDLADARNSFDDVEQELRGNRMVHRQLMETERALNALRIIPGHGPRPVDRHIECIAVDTGFEEHPRGHVGYGATVARAERAAMRECSRFHGRCEIRRCSTAR